MATLFHTLLSLTAARRRNGSDNVTLGTVATARDGYQWLNRYGVVMVTLSNTPVLS